MSDYVPVEFPKWVGDTVVADVAEEHAVLETMTAPGVGDLPPNERAAVEAEAAAEAEPAVEAEPEPEHVADAPHNDEPAAA